MPSLAGPGEPHRVSEAETHHGDAHRQLRATLMARLVEVSDTLQGHTSTAAAAAAVGRALLMLTGAARAAVFLRSQNGAVTCAWSENMSDEYVDRLRTPQGANPWTHLARHPELSCMDLPPRRRITAAAPAVAPAVVEDIRALPAGNESRQRAESEGIRSLCSWPLSCGGRVFAAIAYYFDTPHACPDAEREVVLAFALQAAAALEQATASEARHVGVAEGRLLPQVDVEAGRLAALQRALDAEQSRLSAERSDLAALAELRRRIEAETARLETLRAEIAAERAALAEARAELEAGRAALAEQRRALEADRAKLEPDQ